MKGIVKTNNGYIMKDQIITFTVRNSPGYHDHQQVFVELTNGKLYATKMYEQDFLKALDAAQ